MYTYFMYGVGIASDIKLYDLNEKECETEIRIKRISQGLDEDECVRKHVNYIPLKNGIWFLNRCGQFYILEGNRIEIFPKEGVDDLTLSTFITGWCMAFLFSQRHFSAFHCTALEIDGGCVLVSGDSGAGKSTTAMRLIDRGCRYLADDMAMVSHENDYMVMPAFPVQKMCRDVAEKISDGSLLYVDVDKDKFARTNTRDFCDEARRLKMIVLLKRAYINEVETRELVGLEKFTALLKALFLDGMFEGPDYPAEEKFRVLQIAGACRVISITRPVVGNTLEQICDIIEEESRRQ